MADSKKYKVLVPELSIPASIGELRDIYGNVVGHNHVNTTYFEGDVLDESQVSPTVQEAVERGELEGRLEETSASDEVGPASAQPIVGYDDLSVDQVRGLFRILNSEQINRIKEYEREFGDNRPEIADYDIGRGEAYVDRGEGNAGSEYQEGAEKDTSQVTTREVGEDTVQFGEGVIGDGQPDVEPGTAKAAAERSSRTEGGADASQQGDEDEGASASNKRSGRSKAQKPDEDKDE